MHCLKYGLTTNNLLGIEMVLMTGEVVRLGGKHLDCRGYDLMGLMTGSEGLLGVVTEVTVRLLRKPATARAVLLGFPTEAGAADCVAAVIAAGIIPGGMEMMDQAGDRRAAEAFVGAGYPMDAEAPADRRARRPAIEVDHLVDRVGEIAATGGATDVRVSRDEAGAACYSGPDARRPSRPSARSRPTTIAWTARFRAAGWPRCWPTCARCRRSYGLRVANVFHAGDGNLHPLILYDANDPGELERAEEFGADILRLCVEVGGVLTGEHGVGVEKRDLMGVHVQRDRPRPAAAREMRLRSRPSAQSRQGVPPAAPLRRARPRAWCTRTSCRSPTSRGSEAMAGTIKPRDAEELRQAVDGR